MRTLAQSLDAHLFLLVGPVFVLTRPVPAVAQRRG
jgi:hypothetical protein